MLAVLGQVGKMLLPQLATMGAKILGNSGIGRSIKKFAGG
jgi:hypothetical protein